jgi:ectoine hydroxylase-related dioxygenase (phytanoyl-CoA dioxygenase family)
VKNENILHQDGFTILTDFLSPARVAALRDEVERLYAEEGERAGSEFRQEPNSRRLANLVDKGPLFRQMVAVPQILDQIAEVLGPKFKLSSLNARSANAHSDSAQPLHCDMGAIPDEHGYWVCNTVWMLDDFTTENGALRVVPGSHRLGQLPPGPSHPDEVLVTGSAGTVVVMNAHMWHGGTANRTGSPRRAIHGFYCRSDKPQQQYQKALLRPETVTALSPGERAVLALDDPENDRLSSAAGIQKSGFLK